MVTRKRNRGSRDTDFKYVDLDGVPLYKRLGVKQKTVRSWNAEGKLGNRLKAKGVKVRAGLVIDAAKVQTSRGNRPAPASGATASQPVGMPTPTVTVAVRMPVEMRARIQRLVNDTGVTIQQVVVQAVDQALKEQRY